jgi:hypothetical protein
MAIDKKVASGEQYFYESPIALSAVVAGRSNDA